jgi:hypothetical protein
MRKDVLHLQRARSALRGAKAALKQFSASNSVVADKKLSAAVGDLRRRLKRLRKLARGVDQLWSGKATH